MSHKLHISCVGGLIGVSLLLCPTSAWAQDETNVTGQVIAGDTNRPLAYATVVATQRKGVTAGAPQIFLAETDESGRFSINVPTGTTYSLCVHNIGQYLDPCRWSTAPAVTASTDVAPVTLALDRGIPLRVVIRNANELRGSKSGPAFKFPTRPIGVYLTRQSDGLRMPVPMVGQIGDRIEFFDVIPDDSSWRVKLAGRPRRFVDQYGRAYANEAGTAVPDIDKRANERSPLGVERSEDRILIFSTTSE
jgi:hypothetical protein